MRSTEAASFDVIVLGAGISGLVSASILLGQGHQRILVVDEYDHIGGNHIDRTHGPYTFDIGSLIFQDDSPLLRHFPELLAHYVPISPSWSRLNPQGMVTDYPFSVQDDLLAAGPLECARILGSAIRSRTRRRPLRHAADFGRHWIGPRLMQRSGLESYMERFFGLPADQVDLTFAEQRMGWISDHASVRHFGQRLLSLARPKPPGRPKNRQLVRPQEGFDFLYRPATDRLEAAGVTFRLGSRLQRLTRTAKGFGLATDDQTVEARRVVSTIPLDRALDVCGVQRDRALPTVTLVSLFYSFSGRRGFDSSILYNFSHQGAWKRLTVYSDFYGPAEGREYFAVEVIGERVGCLVEQAAEDFRSHTTRNGLLRGDLRLEGNHILTQAYPVYTDGAGDRARELSRRCATSASSRLAGKADFSTSPRPESRRWKRRLRSTAERPSGSSGLAAACCSVFGTRADGFVRSIGRLGPVKPLQADR